MIVSDLLRALSVIVMLDIRHNISVQVNYQIDHNANYLENIFMIVRVSSQVTIKFNHLSKSACCSVNWNAQACTTACHALQKSANSIHSL